MPFATIIYPAAPIRRKPDHRKEMVNQLLFGESVEVLREKGSLWLKVRSLHDNYEGWITRSLVHFVEPPLAQVRPALVTSDLLTPVQIRERIMHIPFGSSLPFFENGKGMIGDIEFSGQLIAWDRNKQEDRLAAVLQLGEKWMQAPYCWGGRTILGVDCSGFVQILMKMVGIDLPRDAWQQAQEGEVIEKFKEAIPGDLVFFDNKEDIVHVGILIGNDRLIHSSGQVRIDRIDKRSVIHAGSGKRMQQLKAIRRILP